MEKPDLRGPGGVPPTYKQEEYAAALVERLREDEHWQAEIFARRVLNCNSLKLMSSVIASMLKALQESKEADEFVDASHREEP